MRDIMFDIPSNPTIEKCIITKETVVDGKKPEIVVNEHKKPVIKKKKKRSMPNTNAQETA